MNASVTIQPNANFHSLTGSCSPKQLTEAYKNYRTCWEEYPKSFLVRELPMHLDLEASSRCNLRCTFCDKLPLLETNQLGDMDFSLFQHVLDQFSPEQKLWGLKLSYRGEPLINPRVPEMVAYAKKKGVLDVYFNTNAMLLTEEKSRQLIEAGLDRISISIDGTTKEEFESVRIGANLAIVLQNITKLRDLKKEYQVEYPKIRIQSVYFPGMDLEKYQTTWRPYADEVAAVDYKEEAFRDQSLKESWACPQLWQRMTIEWDGSVFGCNNDDLRKLYLGNVKERSIAACWQDESLKKVRQLHQQGQSHLVEACNGCPWRTAQIQKKRNAHGPVLNQ